jgi:mRNA interferase MazF
MVVRQGDIFWIELPEPRGSEPGYRRPYVIVQNNAFNSSPINTTVACALTTNLRLAKAPGNVLLKRGESGIPRTSVINITQLWTVNKAELTEKVGSLSRARLREVLSGLRLLFDETHLNEN